MAVQKSGSEACRIPLLYHLIAGFRQSGGDDLRHVEQLRGGLRKRPERVAEHGLAERTRRTDHRGPGAGEFPGALDIHALPLLLPEEHHSAPRATTETALARTARFHDL